ncbi:tape measure protein [Desulfobulbus oligotrophicus]|uniref:Tape measure protein n=1 Tax=Desulfobulbus oligotrophicus TaxID=1909699 RepID=A0A7T5VEM0_9BACT|nr:tape measure protein [Desulfobulbus oligotrophicus]QQG66362.1 tape measure protein [Desulfobulbus oligotrophicus]
MRRAAIAAFSIKAIRGYAAGFVQTADAMRAMDQRLLLTARNTNDYAAAQKTVVEIARDAHQGLGEVAQLYTRMAQATANLNVSQKDLAEVTRTVALATALSGSSAQEAAAGLLQFSQAMGANRLQGDELRSVLENMPILTKVFVDAAGGSIARLREMATAGELTTEWMINAIKAGRDTIEAQAKAMPVTVGAAMADLRNEASIYIASVNQSTGATDKLAAAIKWLGTHLDTVAQGGFLALSAALSYLVGRGLSAATAAISGFIGKLAVTPVVASAATAAVSANARALTSYGAAASIATAQTAANTAAQTAATAAQTAAGTVMSRLPGALLGLVNPITAVTTVLGLGAAAWLTWGRSADNELAKAKGRVAELQRTNQMLKELSDPSLRLQATSRNITAARAEVAKLEKDLADAVAEPSGIPFDNTIGRTARQLEEARKDLKDNEQEHAEIQENIRLTTEQRGAKQIAVEMSVTDEIRKQNEERRKLTASKLENDLAEIEKKRQAELKSIESRFQGEDGVRVRQAVNARFDAEAAKAREGAAEKSAKKGDAAARKAEAEAKRRERELLKEQKIQSKIDAETLRAESEKRILALEGEKLGAERLGSELERAEALLEINRKIAAERIALKEQEARLIADDPNKTQADLLRAQSEITRERISALQQEHTDLASVASAGLADIEQAWRRGTGSVEAYRQAVQEALAAGVILEEEARDRMIASGDDMGAALSLGMQRARERMQTDAEMMIQIGTELGDRISDGLVSAWDSWIQGTASAKEALIDFARSTISWLSQVILKQMLMNALMGAPGTTGGGLLGMLGMATGGTVQALASGGSVRGWSPSRTADNITIRATAGEFMQPVRAVDYYGLNFMERIRRLELPRDIAHALAGGTVPSVPSGYRLAQGGMPEAGPQTTVKAGDTKLRVINVLDKNMVGDFLRTADGETAIINMIRRNGATIRTLIGG